MKFNNKYFFKRFCKNKRAKLAKNIFFNKIMKDFIQNA